MKVVLERIETKLDGVVSTSCDHEKRIRNLESTPNEQLADHEDRIRALEGKPGKRWDGLVGAAIGAIVAAAITYFLK